MRPALLMLPVLVVPVAMGQDESIRWSSIDAGGGVSRGGEYTMLAVIGQPESGVSSGGPLTLTGGFIAGLVKSCRADLDSDGRLTVFDFLAFQNLFSRGDTRADFNGDGDLNIFDFLAFQNEFSAGC